MRLLWYLYLLYVQLELTLGAFPYGKWTTIFEQLNAVVNGPPPKLPDDGRYSRELQDFAAAWWVGVVGGCGVWVGPRCADCCM